MTAHGRRAVWEVLMFFIGVGALVVLFLAASSASWIWRQRIDKLRRKAEYPLSEPYPPPQPAAMTRWPWK